MPDQKEQHEEYPHGFDLRLFKIDAKVTLPELDHEDGAPEIIDGVLLQEIRCMAETGLDYKARLDVLMADMPTGVAEKIRFMRTVDYTWREVAQWAHDAMSLNRLAWWPPNNEMAGMALCEKAAETLEEDDHGFPWRFS